MKNIFTQHPNSVNETYWQHFRFAMKNGMQLLFVGAILMFHGVFPFLFQNAARDKLTVLAERLLNRNPIK